jgi:hypothetical protein
MLTEEAYLTENLNSDNYHSFFMGNGVAGIFNGIADDISNIADTNRKVAALIFAISIIGNYVRDPTSGGEAEKILNEMKGDFWFSQGMLAEAKATNYIPGVVVVTETSR